MPQRDDFQTKGEWLLCEIIKKDVFLTWEESAKGPASKITQIANMNCTGLPDCPDSKKCPYVPKK